MQVIIAEKPSVARDIATVLGANNKREGYFEGNGYVVTYAFGHLVSIAEPGEMDPNWGSPWRFEQLPMIPKNWKYGIAKNCLKQFQIIRKLFLNSETTKIICATDAGREGEHIFRLIYKLSGSKKPVERLWISSLTAESIKEGFKKLKPAKEFDNLAKAASARAHADWLVGLNFTRAYTTLNKDLCTIGRVQTPTLALIVQKQIEIDSFKSKTFYEIHINLAHNNNTFLAKYITNEKDQQVRIENKEVAESVIKEIDQVNEAKVYSLVTQEKRNKAPGLYDLLTLQKDANKRFGYTAQETLAIAQSLYEEYKLLSYPRTESRHLSKDMIDELPKVIDASLSLKSLSPEAKQALAKEDILVGKCNAKILKSKLNKSYVDDTKLTDHHAIIPTHKISTSKLPLKQQNIYELVVKRFLSIFLPPEIREETTAILLLNKHLCRARGIIIKDLGWTILEQKNIDALESGNEKSDLSEPANSKKAKSKKAISEADDEMQKLPKLKKDDIVNKINSKLKEGKTSPPKPYDDAGILSAMKNAGQEIDDEDLASYMKQKGLGTPATRAAIIERLIQTAYIERQKKHLIPTEKGKTLIQQVHQDLKNVSLTASWEQKLAYVQDGKLELELFETEISALVIKLLQELKNLNVQKNNFEILGNCPKCETGSIRFTPRGAGCSRWKEACNFTVWRETYGKVLEDEEIKELVQNQKTKLITGFKKKDSEVKYDAYLVLDSECKVRLEFPNRQLMSKNYNPTLNKTR